MRQDKCMKKLFTCICGQWVCRDWRTGVCMSVSDGAESILTYIHIWVIHILTVIILLNVIFAKSNYHQWGGWTSRKFNLFSYVSWPPFCCKSGWYLVRNLSDGCGRILFNIFRSENDLIKFPRVPAAFFVKWWNSCVYWGVDEFPKGKKLVVIICLNERKILHFHIFLLERH